MESREKLTGNTASLSKRNSIKPVTTSLSPLLRSLVETPESDSKVKKSKEPKIVQSCKYCRMTLLDRAACIDHMKEHFNVKPVKLTMASRFIKCLICERVLSKSKLLNHVKRVHKDKKYEDPSSGTTSNFRYSFPYDFASRVELFRFDLNEFNCSLEM